MGSCCSKGREDAESSNHFNQSLTLFDLETLSTLPVPSKHQESLNLFNNIQNFSIPNAYLPQDIIAKILSYSSVQSLLRFRSTAKSIRSLIDSQEFTTIHLHNSISLNIVIRLHDSFYHSKFPAMSTRHEIALPTPQQKFCSDLHTALIGSCRGLTCIFNGVEIIFLNIITRRHKVVIYPNLDFDTHSAVICLHGFGVDEHGCYKFLIIRCAYNLDAKSCTCEVILYNSKTNLWSQLPDILYAIMCVPIRGVFLKKHLHWILSRGIKRYDPVLVAFDLTSDVFKEINLPNGAIREFFKNGVPKKAHMLELCQLLGCLCLVMVDGIDTQFWLLKGYETMEWNILFSLPSSILDVITLRPIYYYERRILFELNTRKIIWYDLETKEISYVDGCDEVNECLISTEGLTHA